MSDSMTRRDFVSDTAKATFGAMIVPRHVLGGAGYQAPSDTLNIAIIGAGQQGTENAEDLVAENLVAFCDVDLGFAERNVMGKQKDREGKDRPDGVKLIEQFKKATKYTDFRELLDKQKDIDAVLIATPDHLHATIAKAAMQLKKHVFVQKPLTYSVYEARMLARLAKETGVVTQMGNQGHSSNDARLINEWVQAGLIGPVRDVHIWTNRPIWPQGIPRPTQPVAQVGNASNAQRRWNSRMINDRTAAAMWGDFTVPDGFRWDLYLGPIAEDFPYHPVYHPFNWRGWTAFGVGALGDMGAHLIDHPYWALGLTYPTSIEATSTPWGTVQIPAAPGSESQRPSTRLVSYPQAMTVHYEFPARGSQPPVKMHWYDGGLMPPRPDVLPETIVVNNETRPLQLNAEGGVIFVGEKGILMHETYGGNPKLYPESLMSQTAAVPQTYARIKESHRRNWALACKGEAQASSPFDYGAALTEVMLLGIVALRTGQGRKIHYNAERMEVTNVPDANQYLTREYRAGWTI
jgi:predicted dehydrogenase